MKTCKVCQQNKDDSAFRTGRAVCLECISKQRATYYQNHKQELINYSRLWAIKNQKKRRDYSMQYSEEHRQEAIIRAGRWAKQNRERVNETGNRSYHKNRERKLMLAEMQRILGKLESEMTDDDYLRLFVIRLFKLAATGQIKNPKERLERFKDNSLEELLSLYRIKASNNVARIRVVRGIKNGRLDRPCVL
jgi:hypothetical protein